MSIIQRLGSCFWYKRGFHETYRPNNFAWHKNALWKETSHGHKKSPFWNWTRMRKHIHSERTPRSIRMICHFQGPSTEFGNDLWGREKFIDLLAIPVIIWSYDSMHVFTKPKSSLFISARLDHSQRIAYCVRGPPAIPRRGIRQKMSLFPCLHQGRRAKLLLNITNIGKLIFRGRYPLNEGMNVGKRFKFSQISSELKMRWGEPKYWNDLVMCANMPRRDRCHASHPSWFGVSLSF